MASQSTALLLARANSIRTSVAGGAVTPSTVGALMRDMIDSSVPGTVVSGLTPTLSDAVTAAANTAAIQAAMVAVSAAGGGVVQIPPGTFYLFGSGNIALSFTGLTNVWVRGSGWNQTVLIQANGAESNIFNIDGATNVEISDMTIDGNRAGNTAGTHAVRTGNGGCSGLRIHDMEIRNCVAYGLGLQGGDKLRVFLQDLWIHDTGADCIDIKNKDSGNEVMIIERVVAERWGLDLALTVQAGVDCRGPCQLNDIWCFDPPADGYGIRFREGEIGTPTVGLGAHRSHLTNFFVDMTGSTTGIGVYSAARDVVIEGGYIKAAIEGVTFFGERCTAIGVTAESCTSRGYITTIEAVEASLINCRSNTCVTGFRIRSPRSRLVNPQSKGDTSIGIVTESGATDFTCTAPIVVGVGGATMIGIDLESADGQVIGGSVSTCNRGVVVGAARAKLIGVTSSSNVDAGILAAVGGDDMSVVDCSSQSNGTRGVHTRAARTTVRGGEITGNSTGFLTEATASDAVVERVQFATNTLDVDDAGTNTTIVRRSFVNSLLNQAVAASGTSANIDIPIDTSTRYLFMVEAEMEDSASARATVRSQVQTMRSASAAPTAATVVSNFTAGSGLTLNTIVSGNNLRVNVTKSAGTSCRMDIRVRELERNKTVEFS